MSERDEYESESTADRQEVAAVLSDLADGILAGSIRFGDDADAVTVDAPQEMSLELELETEDDEVSVEVELEWRSPADGSGNSSAEVAAEADTKAAEADSTEAHELDATGASEPESTEDEPSGLVGAADASQSLARFEVYRDQAEEWRWRLRHRNGNVIATSGEGYTRKHNAWKGLRSVMANAPDAAVIDDSTN